MNAQVSHTTLGTLLVVLLGWIFLAAWGAEPLIVSPQPVHLTRQLVSMVAG